MDSVAGKFEQANQSLERMLSSLMRELDSLRAQWFGRGAAAFDQARLHWGEDQKKLHAALAETAAAIRSAGRVYTAADDEAAGRFGAGGGHSLSLNSLPL